VKDLNYKLYLVLGCFGRKDDSFVSCNGVENNILEINNSLLSYKEIMDYFDGVRLFDKPSFDLNNIRHILYNLQNKYDQGTKRIWSESKYRLYEKFLLRHKDCGNYIKLSLSNDNVKNEEEEDIVYKVHGTPEPIITPPKFKIIRGRR